MKNLVKSILKKTRSRWHNDIYAKVDECITLCSKSNIISTPPLFILDTGKAKA